MKKFSSILIGFIMLMVGVGVGRLSAGNPDAPSGEAGGGRGVRQACDLTSTVRGGNSRGCLPA